MRVAEVVESATGRRTANSSPPSRAASRSARQGLPQPVGGLQQQPVAGEVSEGVVDRPEAVEVDQHQGGAGTDALRVVQRGPGPLQQPLPVGQAGERVAQLLLGAGAGDPQSGVEGDERDREQRQQQRFGDGDHADQRGDAEQCHGDQALSDQGGAGDGGQAGPRGLQVPQQGAGDGEVGDGDEHHLGRRVHPPGGRVPGLLHGRHGAADTEQRRPRGDTEDVHRAMQHTVPPAAPAGYADQDDDGEADHAGRDPAVEQQDRQGEGGAGAGAAPPAGAAEHDQMADDDAGEHGQRPAGGAGREERVAAGERPVEAGAQHEGGGRDDRRGQRGPGQVPFAVGVRADGGGAGPRRRGTGAGDPASGAAARCPGGRSAPAGRTRRHGAGRRRGRRVAGCRRSRDVAGTRPGRTLAGRRRRGVLAGVRRRRAAAARRRWRRGAGGRGRCAAAGVGRGARCATAPPPEPPARVPRARHAAQTQP